MAKNVKKTKNKSEKNIKNKIEQLDKEFDKEIENFEIKPSKDKKNIVKFSIWIGFIVIFLPLFLIFRWDKIIFGIAVLIVGLLSQGINLLFGLASQVPMVGPVFLKFIALPIVLILNALGNILAFFGMKLGYKKELMHSRTLSITFIVGFFLGYLLKEVLR